MSNENQKGCSQSKGVSCLSCHYEAGYFASMGSVKGDSLVCAKVPAIKINFEEEILIYGSLGLGLMFLIMICCWCKCFQGKEDDFYDTMASQSMFNESEYE